MINQLQSFLFTCDVEGCNGSQEVKTFDILHAVKLQTIRGWEINLENCKCKCRLCVQREKEENGMENKVEG